MRDIVEIAICADDFGLHPAVNDAVYELLAAGRLSAVSCLVEGPAWNLNIAVLRTLGVDVGLHLNLTEALPDVAFSKPLPTLIALSVSRALASAKVRAAIETQLDAFELVIGRAPDFVDGHQHVHQLPVVREQLLQALQCRYDASRLPWLRRTARPARGGAWLSKARVIEMLGCAALADQAQRLGFAMNAHLLGVYDLAGSGMPYGERIAHWLRVAGRADLLMCHPSASTSTGDPIATARLQEYAYLSSPSFAELLVRSGIQIARMSKLLSGAGRGSCSHESLGAGMT